METRERDLTPLSSLEGGTTELVLGLEGASSPSRSQTGVGGMEGRLSIVARKSPC